MKYTEEHEWLREEDGVIVVGMGQFTSYAYPAGLNLEEILLI